MASYQYLTDRGVIIPDTAQTKQEVIADFQAAFGADMPVDDATPQGVLINLDVETRDNVARNNAEVANQINPDIAGGIFLDGIWAFLGGERRKATRSQIIGAVFSGTPNVLIPAGSIAEVALTGDTFRTTQPMIIGPLGSVTGDMEAVDFGPIQVPVGGLDSVASSVLGWETVTNPNAAIPGMDEESDASARRRRRQTLAIQGLSISEAITSQLYSLEGVKSLAFRENIASTTQVIDGITMVAHSVWVCVDGGDSTEIANALHRTKTMGAAWNGAVVVNIVDQYSGQDYAIRFDRPAEIQIFARITVRPSSFDAQTLIPNIIEEYVNGDLEGDSGLTVGRDVSPWKLSGAINQVQPMLYVSKVELSTDGITYSTNNLPIALDEVARLPIGSVQVLVV